MKSSTLSALFTGAGTSNDPCDDTYHGTHAFSEPETAAMAKFLTSLQDRLLLYMDIHAFSQLWMTNYGYEKNARPRDAADVVCYLILEEAAISIKTNSNTCYEATLKSTNRWQKLKTGKDQHIVWFN